MPESDTEAHASICGQRTSADPVLASPDLDAILRRLAEVLAPLIKVSALSLKIVDSAAEIVFLKRGDEFRREIVYGSRILAGDGFAARALATGDATVVDDLAADTGSAYPSYVSREDIKSLVAVPLVLDGRGIGLLTVYLCECSEVSPHALAIASMVAGVAATIVRNSGLAERMEKDYFLTVEALTAAIEAKDPYTRGHSRRVTQFAMVLGERFGLAETDVKNLRYGAALHDIGKIGIGGHILHKKGRLSREEFEIIKQHPAIGERIIERVAFLQGARPIVRSHHERFDGTGYPDGLRDEEIPFLARIAAVVDLFDALTTDRPYRKAYSAQQTCLAIKQGIGREFDPVVAREFLGVIPRLEPEVGRAQEVPIAATPLPSL